TLLPLALTLALAQGIGLARAGEPDARCSARVHAWVADAGRAAGVPAHALQCGADRVVLRLEPRGAAPLDVEVTRAPDRAFRRSGSLGVSPLLQVDDFQKVPAARREPFERLMGWIDRHEGEVAFGGGSLPPEIRAPVERVGVRSGAAWILAAALVLAL